ncbi:hypothetical protein HAX54_043707, partial [Datura stramonium]|nr:hypothetical protein [Datura stramonium]
GTAAAVEELLQRSHQGRRFAIMERLTVGPSYQISSHHSRFAAAEIRLVQLTMEGSVMA